MSKHGLNVVSKLDKIVTTRVSSEWVEESKHYLGGVSEFVRRAILAYKDCRHKFMFFEISELVAGEILALEKWRDNGHPAGAKWTEDMEDLLFNYHRIFEILENSPLGYND